MASYKSRKAEKTIVVSLADPRGVIVNGARPCGKSTVVREVTRLRPQTTERRLDLPAVLQSAKADPTEFVVHDGLLVIDEIQRAPELVLPIKATVDIDNRPGQFLLTGSARIIGLRSLPDALVGRSETIELWPFSQGELDAQPDRFIDTVFSSPVSLTTSATLTKADYITRSLRGGFPEAVERDETRRRKFFDGYINDIIDRDVVQLAEIQRRPELQSLLRLLAARMAAPLAVQTLSDELRIAQPTAERYVALFEEVFLIKRIPAWTNRQTTRATKARKLIYVDSALGAHLAGVSVQKAIKNPAGAGNILENFVLAELARQLSWQHVYASLYHYRTRDGIEVDAVIEANDGRIVGVEVKGSSTVGTDDFRHLTHLREAVGSAFQLGVVLYTGTAILPFGDRLIAAPIDTVWHSGPKEN